ncbi:MULTISPECIES: hypothetical protein [Sphingobium]|nr:hypothetical protein [Sphingobium sp. AntQ-1]
MSHPRLVSIPTADHHDALGFALSLEMVRAALCMKTGERLRLHLSDEVLIWGPRDALTYSRRERSGQVVSIALDGGCARRAFAQLVQDGGEQH